MGTVVPIEVVVYSLSANGVLDDGSPMYAYVKVPSIITSITECAVSLAFRQFSANAKTAAASGTLTSDSGGGSTSGASSATTSGSESTHVHTVGLWNNDSPAALTKRRYDGNGADDNALSFNLETSRGSVGMSTFAGSAHNHGIPHTHTTPSHQHTVPTHTHNLTYGTYEEAYPASHSVFVNVYKRVGGAWTLQGSRTSITADLVDLDLTDLITGPGDYQLRIKSDAAQPNNGRLGLDLYGAITAQIG